MAELTKLLCDKTKQDFHYHHNNFKKRVQLATETCQEFYEALDVLRMNLEISFESQTSGRGETICGDITFVEAVIAGLLQPDCRKYIHLNLTVEQRTPEILQDFLRRWDSMAATLPTILKKTVAFADGDDLMHLRSPIQVQRHSFTSILRRQDSANCLPGQPRSAEARLQKP
jgi:hypothetical protein